MSCRCALAVSFFPPRLYVTAPFFRRSPDESLCSTSVRWVRGRRRRTDGRSAFGEKPRFFQLTLLTMPACPGPVRNLDIYFLFKKKKLVKTVKSRAMFSIEKKKRCEIILKREKRRLSQKKGVAVWWNYNRNRGTTKNVFFLHRNTIPVFTAKCT